MIAALIGVAVVLVDDGPAEAREENPPPRSIKVTPGDGQPTVTREIASRDGFKDSEIRRTLRRSQEFGGWSNPRDPRGVGPNDGVSMDPGVTTDIIKGLKNGVGTGVFARSMTGHRDNLSGRDGASRKWVGIKGVNTTPVTPSKEVPTVTVAIDDVTIVCERGAHEESLSGVSSEDDEDDLSITADSSDEAMATVSVSADYSKLTVTAKARAAASITVTGDDGEATAADTFTVKVKSTPAVASAIAGASGLSIGDTQNISPSGVFSEADADALNITAPASKDVVATVVVATDQSGLTVTAMDAGTASIAATAQDTDGNRVSDAFDVTVVAKQQVNNPPTVSSAISDATILNESGTRQDALSGVFADADQDSLTVTAISSDGNVATVFVSVDQVTLTVSAQARGTATNAVTADDGDGGLVEDTFTVTVKATPVVASVIAHVSELEIGATHEVSMSGVFTDADGDAITVTDAVSSGNTVAVVWTAIDEVTGAITAITVFANSTGPATITVKAQVSDGNSVSDSFDLTVPAAQRQEVVELPGPVVSLDVTASVEGSVTVNRHAPEGGGVPDGYIVHVRPEGGETGSGRTKTRRAKKISVTFKNLEAGITYEVWVPSENEAGKNERVHATITLAEEGDGQSGQ